jgi:plasmid stabilization system protein ParE
LRGFEKRARPAGPGVDAWYEFHPEAEQDLVAIWEYIAEDSERAADRVIDQIEVVINQLAQFPNSGHRRTDLTGLPLRFATSGS